MKDRLRATTTDIRDGPSGPYAIARVAGMKESVTFSLRKSVWKETGRLKKGDRVLLTGLQQNEDGWRATSARFLQPSDEQDKQPQQHRRKPSK